MEKWEEIYTPEQIKRIQKVEIENLNIIRSICEELGITFIAYGGTMLGTVKFQGFVPWDDDLDIAMVREDYEKFVQNASRLLPEGYVLQTPYADKKSPYLYTKLRRKGTECIEYCHSKMPIEKGIYVDIYPIDNIADDHTSQKRQHEQFQKIARLFAYRQCRYPDRPPVSAKSKAKAAARVIISFGLHLIPQRCFVSRMDAIQTKYNSVSTVRKGTLFSPNPDNVFYDFYPLQEGMFEGIKVLLPGNWDKHLRMRYGDYTQLPPPEKRIGHKPYLLSFGDQ